MTDQTSSFNIERLPHFWFHSHFKTYVDSVCDIVKPNKRSPAFVLQKLEAPGPLHPHPQSVCLGEQTGLLQSVHGPIMCRQTKAEAASKSLMQNLCSCGCFSGWKNQYCGSDARR